MAILKVARMGHPVLRERARAVDPSEIGTPAVQRLIDDMFETMREYEGIGLAAPQVHEGLRLFVAGVDDPDTTVPPMVMINPVVDPIGSAVEEDWEGCLSIPDVRGKVPRAVEIRVSAFDRSGQRMALTASGFPARVIQHETDHLNGVLFLDRMRSFDSLTYLTEYKRYWEARETTASEA
jgi:peptide deformylase